MTEEKHVVDATWCITAWKTSFDYVISSMCPIVETEVRNLIQKPPKGIPYSDLKE